MSQTLTQPDRLIARSDTPVIWGLSARQLHDAFWNAHGLQCIRIGESVRIDRTADLYLLIDAEQFVLFDIASILERLMWRGAAVTRLRLTHGARPQYRERILLDERGLVSRIERRYNASDATMIRVFLTNRPRLAERWMRSANARDGWRSICSRVPRSRVDRIRQEGRWFREEDADDQRTFLDALVTRWQHPDRVIEGLTEAGSGVWTRNGTPTPRAASTNGNGHRNGDSRMDIRGTAIGPVWLGDGRHVDAGQCIVGPAWFPDDADAHEAIGGPAPVKSILDIEAPETMHRTHAPGGRFGYQFAKRVFDIVGALAVLILASPLIAAIALLIVITDGRPVFFRHRRETRGGREFDCLKFRTMFNDSQVRLEEIIEQNRCDGPQVMIPDDPRITGIGALLRRANLDELPQFWNVLKGEMSIVGPRPSPEKENQICPAWRELRLSVRPGITGLWQLKRTRAEGQDFQEWIRYDIEYVRSAGFFFDLWICLQTARMMIMGRRADDQ